MIVSGDRVKVSVDVESFKRSQEDHGGWNHLMNQVSCGYESHYKYHQQLGCVVLFYN